MPGWELEADQNAYRAEVIHCSTCAAKETAWEDEKTRNGGKTRGLSVVLRRTSKMAGNGHEHADSHER